jgi:hypothetical protein
LTDYKKEEKKALETLVAVMSNETCAAQVCISAAIEVLHYIRVKGGQF